MTQFKPTIRLFDLNTKTALKIFGEPDGNRNGSSVAPIGDFNGDGIDDIIIGSPDNPDPAATNPGASYVIFGKKGGFTSNINLSSLPGNLGIKFVGREHGDFTGISVSGAGDINNDGINDLIISAPGADPQGIAQAGVSYLLYGQSGLPQGSIALADLDGLAGLPIIGFVKDALSGSSVSNAGDVNADGIDDFIVNAPSISSAEGGQALGSAYVIFGVKGGLGSSLPLSAINGMNGFKVTSDNIYQRGCQVVTSIGDFNNDGIDDIAVSAPGGVNTDNGKIVITYASVAVIYGRSTPFESNIFLNDLDGVSGFRIYGNASESPNNSGVVLKFKPIGSSISNAGDINGDGIADMIVGAADFPRPEQTLPAAGGAYVIFGRSGDDSKSFNLNDLNGVNGFEIIGELSTDFAGQKVASAGDVNGDGFDDVLISGRSGYGSADVNGSAYVVFGRPSFSNKSINLTSLNGENGFRILGGASAEFSGKSISGAGDLNNDGFDDILIGAINTDDSNLGSDSTYVIYGVAPDQAVNRVGSKADQTLAGGAFNDILDGRGGSDRLFGHAGDDVYIVDVSGDRVFEIEGGGNDKVLSSSSYSLSAGQEIEALQLLTSTGSAALNLTGNEFSQTLVGNNGANALNGAAGVDTMIGRGGNDTYIVDNAGDQVVEAVGGGSDTVLSSVGYTLTAGQEIEALQLLSSTGSAALNLTGNEFSQTLVGNNGANALNGGLGADILIGRGGADTFVFSTALGAGNVDRITDFVASTAAVHDTIQLSKSVFSALSAGALSSAAFKDLSVTGATIDADDRILYNKATGALSYDADGSGSKAAVQFATIDTKVAMTAADFFVV